MAAIAVMLVSTHAFGTDLNPDFSGLTVLHSVLTEPVRIPPTQFTGNLHTLASRIHDKYEHGFRYMDSEKQYGAGNYWPTRRQTLQSHSADCKGFAVAAFDDLLEAGVPEDTVFIWVVVLRKTGEIHAVVIAGGFIIDRLVDRVITLQEARTIYTNIYRFNRKGWTQEGP
jgi:predicted transglutaminase-like cysteine proteinase